MSVALIVVQKKDYFTDCIKTRIEKSSRQKMTKIGIFATIHLHNMPSLEPQMLLITCHKYRFLGLLQMHEKRKPLETHIHKTEKLFDEFYMHKRHCFILKLLLFL